MTTLKYTKVLFVMMSFATCLNAASFDCAKAKSKVEGGPIAGVLRAAAAR